MSAPLSTMAIGRLRRMLREVADSGWYTLATGEMVALIERLAAAEETAQVFQTALEAIAQSDDDEAAQIARTALDTAPRMP
jgi:hypothetical protein